MSTEIKEEQEHQDLVFDVFNKAKPAPRQPTDFQRSFHLEIYAVGRDVKEALLALGQACAWGEITDITFERDQALSPCEWYVRFHADGTGMKAGGEYVTGGVIVTWWK